MGRKRKNNIEQEAASSKIEQEEDKVENVPPLSLQEMEEHDRVDREYFDALPPGYRFVPTGEELIVHYLNNKVSENSSCLPPNRIRDVNIYKYHPQKLTSMYKLHRGKEWYFFTPRTKKYRNGQRPDRAAGNGFWSATGTDGPICNYQGLQIGTKRTLVYHEGKAKGKNGIKTDWIMHEYINHVDNTNNVGSVDKKDAMKLDQWVLCKIYNKSYKEGKANGDQQDANSTMIVPANNSQLPNQNPNGDTFSRHNVQEPNLTTNQGRDGASFFVPNQNISTQWLDGGSFNNMQNVQVPNTNITQGLDGGRSYNITQGLDAVPPFYNMASLPMQNYQVSNSNSNQNPYGVVFDNTVSFPVQNDGSDHVADNLNNMVSSPLSDYDQAQNIYRRNGPYFHLLDYEPSDTPSQEALQGEELNEYPDYLAIFNFKDDERLDFMDGEHQGPDQASLSSKEKNKEG